VLEGLGELKPIALIIGKKNIKESDGHEQFLSLWGEIKKAVLARIIHK
jgi:hypothetical protein